MHSFDERLERTAVDREQSMIEPAPAPAPAALVPSSNKPGGKPRFIRTILRRLPTVLCAVVACLIAAVVMIRSMTPLYTVSAQIMIQRISGTNASQSPEDRQRVLRNEEDLIVSTPVLASALSEPGIHDLSALRGRSDVMKLVRGQLRVDAARGDDLLNISYDTPNPREGTRLLDAVVSAYVRFRSGLHETSTDGSLATVESEKLAAVQNLHLVLGALQRFCTEHGLAQGNEQVEAVDAVMHDLAVSLAQAHVETVAARAAYDQMQHELASDPRMRDQLSQSMDNDSSLAGGDEQAIAKQICTLQTQLAGYGTKFMANYAPVQLLHRKIDDLKFTRDSIIQQRWETAVRNESELQASYDQEQSIVAAAEVNKQTFDQRGADVLEAQKQVAAIDKQLKDIDAASKQITTMVTVIEPATASDQPTSPRTALILIIASVAGLVLGTGIAGIQEVRSGGEIDREGLGGVKMLADGMPVLARLPAVSRRQLAMNSWRDRMVDSAAEFAEACCKVHDALEAVVSFSGGRTVLVTSTSAREGKSTLASLLALTLAQTGKRVLLVDANLYAPVQGGIFDIDGDYGLGNLLEEEIESSFVAYVHPGTDPRMDLLLAGSAEAPVADLLNSQRFTNLLAAMAVEYDFVLIDSPALSVGPDARIMASSCDATVVLAGESKVNRKVLKATRDSLTSVGAHVIGVVLNGGMAAIAQPEALVNIDVSRHAPVQVATVRPSPLPAAEPVAKPVIKPPMKSAQTVFAAKVRRVPEADPEIQQPETAHAQYIETERPADRFQWMWSYSLVAIVLIGAWMSFHAIWGAASLGAGISPPEEPVAIVMAGSGMVVVMLLAGFQVKPPRQDIAVIVMGSALAGCSFWGGAINTLWSAQQHSAIASAAAEAILLFGSLLFGWSVLRRTMPSGLIEPVEANTPADISLAIFAQVSVMSALLILLSHWHTKGECLAVIAFSSCLATMLAYWMAPLRTSLCFWLSPMVVALFGSLCATISAQGIHAGMLLALARPMPLDYASTGPIGAMLGFWIARSATRIAWPSQLAVE
jgi:polysaccharide biosynthesis transport protein